MTRRKCWQKRIDAASDVDVDDGIELTGDYRHEVVTLRLRFRQVDDADRALQTSGAEHRSQDGIARQKIEVARDRGVKNGRIASRLRRKQRLQPPLTSPFVRGDHRAGVGAEADQERLAGPALARKLRHV